MIIQLLHSQWLRRILASAGALFLVAALWSGRDVLRHHMAQLTWPVMVGVSIVMVGAAACAAWSWAALLGVRFRSSGVAYLQALPAKYIPGGLGLPISQLSFEAAKGDAPGGVVVRLVQHMLLSIGAGGLVGLIALALAPPVSYLPWLLALVLVGVGFLSLPGPVLALTRRFPSVQGECAPQSAVWRAFFVTTAGVGLMSICYALVLGRLAPAESGAMVVAAFAIAWTIGFAVIPLPAGVGLRESVLVLFLPGVGLSLVVLASVILRLLAIVGDALVAVVARLIGTELASREPVG